jgi:hypothetical protein
MQMLSEKDKSSRTVKDEETTLGSSEPAHE